MIKIELEGNPTPWARPGIVRTKKCNIVYDRQKREKDMARWQMRGQYVEEPLKTPLQITFLFRMPIPKSTSAAVRREMLNGNFHHSKKPDLDNLEKFILDAMNGLVYVDDSQVCSVKKDKIYSSNPGTLIHITPYSQNNHSEMETVDDGYNLRDDGPGDILRSNLDKKRYEHDTGQESSVIPFCDR